MISFLIGIFIGILLALPFVLDYSAEIDMLKEANKELLSRVKVDYDVKEINTKINEPKLSPYLSVEEIQKCTVVLKGLQDSKDGKVTERDYKRKKNVKAPKSKGNKARKGNS